mgnify:CR=1 FL=1
MLSQHVHVTKWGSDLNIAFVLTPHIDDDMVMDGLESHSLEARRQFDSRTFKPFQSFQLSHILENHPSSLGEATTLFSILHLVSLV